VFWILKNVGIDTLGERKWLTANSLVLVVGQERTKGNRLDKTMAIMMGIAAESIDHGGCDSSGKKTE
jgi:hypothetical protein